MPGHPRVPKEVTREREATAWRLRQRFWTQEQIAKHLGVSQPAVCLMLARVEKRELAKLAEEFERKKAAQVAQLEYLAQQAVRGWRRSLRDAETVATTTGGEEGGPKTTRTVKGQAGDPSFIARARECLADVRKITGIDAAPKSPTPPPPPDPTEDDYDIDLSADDEQPPLPPEEGPPAQPGEPGAA